VDEVATVSVDVCAVVLAIDTEAGERLQVAGLVAFEGAVVTAQVKVTVPVNEFEGVTVMVAAPPFPGLTAMLPLLESVMTVPVLGACQKSLHPVTKPIRSEAAASRIVAEFPFFIAAPLFRFECL
jgi:hypothetical protein